MKRSAVRLLFFSFVSILIPCMLSGCLPAVDLIDQTDVPTKTPIPAGFYTGAGSAYEKIIHQDGGNIEEYSEQMGYSWTIDQDGFPLHENQRLIPGLTIASTSGNLSLTQKLTSVSATDNSFSCTTYNTVVRYDLVSNKKYTFTGNGNIYFKLLEDGTIEYRSSMFLIDTTGGITDSLTYTGTLAI
jgi:hypothetical protein